VTVGEPYGGRQVSPFNDMTLILLATAFNLGWNLVLGVTPLDQAPEMGLVAAILVVWALGLGLVYIRLDARLRGVGDFGLWPGAKTK